MIEIKQQDIEKWTSQIIGYVNISNQKFHRNAELFLKKISEIHKSIIENIEKKLEKLVFKISENKDKNLYYKRVGATSLNKSLKYNFKGYEEMKFEVEYKEGIMFDSPKTGGFDFALYDEEFNVTNFRNYCFGRKAIFQGKETWNKEVSKKRRTEWKSIAEKLDLLNKNKIGLDISIQKTTQLLLGNFSLEIGH